MSQTRFCTFDRNGYNVMLDLGFLSFVKLIIDKFKVIFDIHHRLTAKFVLCCHQLRK